MMPDFTFDRRACSALYGSATFLAVEDVLKKHNFTVIHQPVGARRMSRRLQVPKV